MLVGCKKEECVKSACALGHTTGGVSDAVVRIMLRRDWNESGISRLYFYALPF